MAIQIVMDRTGDSRHPFDPNDAEEVANAEQRFDELTNSASPPRAGPVQVRSGHADPIVRPERGRNRVLSQAGRRVSETHHVAPYAVPAGRALAHASYESPLQ